MSIGDLLEDPPVVVNTGAEALAAAIEAQGSPVIRTDWRPPPPGLAPALDALAGSEATFAANAAAVGQMLQTRARLVDVVPAAEVIPALGPGTFLHAGPPIEWGDCSGPLRGALIGAMLYEGDADSLEEAIVAGPDATLSPCHHHAAVGPMAGVVSSSMPMAVVEDPRTGSRAYTTLNEGLGKVLRYGAYAPEVIDRLRWMESTLGPVLASILATGEGIDLTAITAQALQMGDEGHNRNRAGTSLLLRSLGGALIADERHSSTDRAAVFRFIESNDHFMLNLVMAAGKLAADAASGVDGSSLVTTMARNGTEFGIRLSGTGDRWFTAPAPTVDGLFLPGFDAADANPDIGDSSITETVGLGGFAMAASPAIVAFVGGTAGEALARTNEMYEITLAEHTEFRVPILEFRGTPTGIDAALVVRTGLAPQINTGIAGKEAGVGMVGAGLVSAPEQCFSDAVRALASGLPA